MGAMAASMCVIVCANRREITEMMDPWH